MVKTTKGGKTMNPTDAYRKELRKKELKRNKKERKKVRDVGILKKDPDSLKEQIDKLETMKADGALDKARKHKKRQLEDTLNLVLKKRKEYEDKMKEKGEAPVMFSHLGSVRQRTTAEEDDRANHPRPEDSVYYHPTLNPSGAPPPGKLPMFKSSIGPRVPLSEASTSNQASSSTSEAENADFPPPLPPPPPPPLPGAGLEHIDASIPASFPLPPPPPPPSSLPPKPPMADFSTPFPPPPPPPGPPPRELLPMQSPLPPPPPPPIHQSAQPPPAVTYGIEQPVNVDDAASRKLSQMPSMLRPPPPPPPMMPPTLVDQQTQGSSSKSETKSSSDSKDVEIASLQLPPPPPPPPIPVASMVPNMRPEIFAPGISQFPLPPPPPPRADVFPPIPAPGISGQPIPTGAMPQPMFQMPPYGPPPMMRPPLPPGPPPLPYDDFSARPFVPQKPSYVKSAASTVVKRPLAQHNPELTSMVPASVRVRRESAQSKPKPKTPSTAAGSNRAVVTAPAVVQESAVSSSTSAQKPQSIDESYMAFLEDMKALGALDG